MASPQHQTLCNDVMHVLVCMLSTLVGGTGWQCCLFCRNQLKHIQKIRYVADEVDQYERAWLLLADIYIQSGKFDLAQVGPLLSNRVMESSLFLAAFAHCRVGCKSRVEALLMA